MWGHVRTINRNTGLSTAGIFSLNHNPINHVPVPPNVTLFLQPRSSFLSMTVALFSHLHLTSFFVVHQWQMIVSHECKNWADWSNYAPILSIWCNNNGYRFPRPFLGGRECRRQCQCHHSANHDSSTLACTLIAQSVAQKPTKQH